MFMSLNAAEQAIEFLLWGQFLIAGCACPGTEGRARAAESQSDPWMEYVSLP